jgi:hypothetical protein
MMKKSQVLILILLVLTMTLISGTIFNRFASQIFVQAEATQSAQSGGQIKWEYCAVPASGYQRVDFGSNVYYVTIRYYQSSGWRGERVEWTPVQSDEADGMERVVAKAIAKLGAGGWEMVQERPRSEHVQSMIYFKRPKQ